jgi:iron(III) transport system substrate-binding protein
MTGIRSRIIAAIAASGMTWAAAEEVVWYTAMNTQDAEPLRKRFEEKHPGTKVTVLRQPGEKIRNRILTEARGGKNFWDVVSFNHLDMEALDSEKMLAAYVSPQTKTGYPAGAVHPAGKWAAIYVRQYVIGYNTSSVRPVEVPRDWSDLLQPRWKGKLAIDENEAEWYASMLDYLGRDKGTAFMRALAQQEPQFRRGHTLLSKLLVAGDFPLAIVHAAEMDEARKAGAPVDWVRTLDPVITSPSVIAVAAYAPHPKQARLFVDFVLSEEGQRIIANQGRVPARFETATELKVFYVKPELARDMDVREKEFREIFRR